MSGKTHGFIGLVVAIILWIGYTLGLSGVIKINVLIPMMIGSFIGALIVDIDCKRSKASQVFSAIVTILIWILLVMILCEKYDIFDFSIIKSLEYKRFIYNRNSFGLISFVVLVTLGKLSPHRQFTHKWFGTLLFSITVIITFNKFVAVGFIVGYVSHILADKLTPAGVKFLEFKLPLCDKRGKFSMKF